MRIDGDVAGSRQRLVLLVDGDEESRLLCRTTLSEAGFEVITASDGTAAVLVAGHTSPDVMLLDIDLPTLSPIILARDLRAESQSRHVRIIALTHDLDPQRIEPHATRFDQVLVKPVEPQRIIEAVGGALAAA